MEFDVSWDQAREVALIKHMSLILDSKAVVQAWRESLFAKLEAMRSMRGKKFPIVVCIDNFIIRPKVADAYGRVVREMIERFASDVARYGEPSTVKQIIAVEAMKEGFRANLFETFEQAVGFFDLEHGSAPPTSRSLRSPVGAVGAPSLRGLRSPISPGAEAPSSRSLPPRQVFKSVASKAAAQPTSEEPTNPGSRRPQRITIR